MHKNEKVKNNVNDTECLVLSDMWLWLHYP